MSTAIQALTFYLAEGISATQTTIPVRGLKDSRGNAITAMPAGASTLFATIEPRSPSNQEIISFTGITNNGNGIVTLTGVTRNLSPQPPYTALAANVPHGNNSEIILSNNPSFYSTFAQTDVDTAISAIYTFLLSKRPKLSADGDTTDPAAFVSYGQLLRAALGSVYVSGTTIAATAGETIASGDIVYLNTADQRWYISKADTSAKVENVIQGIAGGSATSGNSIPSGVQLVGYKSGYTGLSAGLVYVNDLGKVSNTAGTIPFPIGVALSATEIVFDPTMNKKLTLKEKDGLVSAYPAKPSSYNPVLTKAELYTDGISVQSVAGAVDVAFGQDDATTKRFKLSQSFIPTKSTIASITLKKGANTGTPTGNVVLNVYAADASDNPTGASLGSVTILLAAWNAIATGADALFTFSSPITGLVPSQKYALELSSTVPSAANYFAVQKNATSIYADGAAKFNNTAQGYQTETGDLNFKVMQSTIGVVPETGADGKIPTAFIPAGQFGSFIAGEALSANDAFFLSSGQPIKRALFYQTAQTQNYNTGYNIGTNGSGVRAAQTFLAKTTSLKSIRFQGNNSGSAGTINATITIEIYATSGGVPTGSPIWSETLPTLSFSGFSMNPIDYNIVTPPTLVAGTVYAIAFDNNSVSSVGVGYSNANPIGTYQACTYDGSNWTAQSGSDLYLELYDEISSPTAGYAYISEGYTQGEHNAVVGIAQAAVAAGQSFTGIVGGAVGGNSFGAGVSTVSEAVDEQCTDGSEVTQQLYTDATLIRQIFRTKNIANLTKLGFKAQKVNGGGGAVTVNVYDLYTQKLVGTGTIADGVITTTAQVYDCTFSTPLNVKPNWAYYFELTSDAGNSGTNYYNITARQTSAPYTYGMALWSGTWNTNFDFHFQTKYTKSVAWTQDDPLYLGFGNVELNSSGLGIVVGRVLTSSQFNLDLDVKDRFIASLSSANWGNQMNSSEEFRIAIPKACRRAVVQFNGATSSQGEISLARFGKTTGGLTIPNMFLNSSFTCYNSDSSLAHSFGSATVSYVIYLYK